MTRPDAIDGACPPSSRYEDDKYSPMEETLEIVKNPQAMTAIDQARRGEGEYYPLSELEED